MSQPISAFAVSQVFVVSDVLDNFPYIIFYLIFLSIIPIPFSNISYLICSFVE